MAERRMFAKTIVDSDAFLDMPVTARLLYYDLAMRADDDGFVNSPKKIMRIIGASQDDLNILIFRKFIIPFDNGIVVIKHWRIHNYIRKDTYSKTPYIDQMAMLTLDENRAYTIKDEPSTDRGRDVDEPSTQVSIDKISIDKDRLDKVSIDNSCSESQRAPVPSIPLNNGAEWFPDLKDYEEWLRAYPGVDIRHQFERMRQWCLSNPEKRKTPKGVRRFVTTWLDKEQNRSSGYRRKEATGPDAYYEVAMEAMKNGTD